MYLLKLYEGAAGMLPNKLLAFIFGVEFVQKSSIEFNGKCLNCRFQRGGFQRGLSNKGNEKTIVFFARGEDDSDEEESDEDSDCSLPII